MACLSPQLVNGKEVPGCKGKCQSCRSLKRWRYSARIAAECYSHQRTWFCTLTLRKNMSDRVGYSLVQRWLKRVRASGVSLRYAAVAEHGSQMTKRLHYHVVVHGGPDLTQRRLRSKWRGGISEATLVRSGDAASVARYSSKLARYVTKDGGSRFRFSQGYGSRALSDICSSPTISAVLRLFPGSSVRVAGINMPRSMVPSMERIWTPEELQEVEEMRAWYEGFKARRSKMSELLRRRRSRYLTKTTYTDYPT